VSTERERVVRHLSELAQEIIERGIDWEKLAAQETARTDPWRWYCRLCGASGEDPDRGGRDWEAGEHLRTTRCGRHEITGYAESGRLAHVWSYPRSAITQWN
jgi:hypothetical protein